MTERAMFKNSIIIGAHPDDELLWFNAALPRVDEVMIAYKDFWAHPLLGEARAAAIADYPRSNVKCLDMAEAGTYGCANWAAPVCNEYGLEFSLNATTREIKRLAKLSLSKVVPIDIRAPDKSVTHAYQENYQLLYDLLRNRLRTDMNVFSHNPWGEYGHEDHVQVFRVLDRLRDEIGFKLWMSNYCTERSLPLASRYFTANPDGFVRLKCDRDFAEKAAEAYKKHGCWTWADDWPWFEDECYMEAPRSESMPLSHQQLLPLNMFLIDAGDPEPASDQERSKAAIR